MKYQSVIQKLGQWLAIALLLTFGLAMAQSEPTLNQIYATAKAGKLDDAQVMVQQVLISHPNSGKAHFVRAELYARQGKLDLARESLASAEKFAPGLPFAKPEAVQTLRTQLSSKPAFNTPFTPAVSNSPPTPASSKSWLLPLLMAGGVIVAGYFIFRRRAPAPAVQQPVYANQNGLNGPQTFGTGGTGVAPPAYPPQPGYAQPGYPPQAGSGLGGKIMGGVATGLAVGAGVMAAEAIGRSLMGDHAASAGHANNLGNNDLQPSNSNPDMGGADFGINDGGSWDDAGSSDVGGGDWDT
jgi:tetratricopeptide (TPR) repeat protein